MASKEGIGSQDIFATTRWTAVLRAAEPQSPGGHQALAELCETYWFPLYVYARRSGCGPHDAEDATQGFFARLFRLGSLAAVRPERGKFRAFLLKAMRNYLADERDRDFAQKRGRQQTVSLDLRRAEMRFQAEPVDRLTPEKQFERQWALTLLETVLQRLRREYEQAGRENLFMELRFALTGEKRAERYAAIALRLGQTEDAIRLAVHRLRQRFREALREEISQTVSTASEIEEELRELQRILSR